MKGCFSGLGKFILIFSLSLTCYLSPAKGIFYHQNSFGKNVYFSFPENKKLRTNFHFHNRLTGKPALYKLSHHYCIFILKVLEKREYNLGLVFIILLSLWSYRKYEITRIKSKQNSGSKGIRADTDQNPHLWEMNHFTRRVKRMYKVLAVNFKPRYCTHSNENEGLSNSDTINETVERDILRILLANIKRNTFCKYICIEKKKCYYSFVKLMVNEPLNSKPEDLDYSQDVLGNVNGLLSEEGFRPIVSSVSISVENKEYLAKTASILNSHYTDYRFSVVHLADELNMSISQLNRKMNLLTGNPSGHLIRNFRLYKASELLLNDSVSVSEVCFSTGFNDLSYFSRAFKKQFGCSPSIYRMQMTKKSY